MYNISIEDIISQAIFWSTAQFKHRSHWWEGGRRLITVIHKHCTHTAPSRGWLKLYTHKYHYPSFKDVRNGQLTVVKPLVQGHTESMTNGLNSSESPFNLILLCLCLQATTQNELFILHRHFMKTYLIASMYPQIFSGHLLVLVWKKLILNLKLPFLSAMPLSATELLNVLFIFMVFHSRFCSEKSTAMGWC